MTSKSQTVAMSHHCGYRQDVAPRRDLHRRCGLNRLDRRNNSFSRCAAQPKKTAK
jgi:hypothetical protein